MEINWLIIHFCFRPHNYFDTNVPDLTKYDSIEEWLTSIKMERYIDHFLQAGFTSMDQVASLTLKDFGGTRCHSSRTSKENHEQLYKHCELKWVVHKCQKDFWYSTSDCHLYSEHL